MRGDTGVRAERGHCTVLQPESRRRGVFADDEPPPPRNQVGFGEIKADEQDVGRQEVVEEQRRQRLAARRVRIRKSRKPIDWLNRAQCGRAPSDIASPTHRARRTRVDRFHQAHPPGAFRAASANRWRSCASSS